MAALDALEHFEEETGLAITNDSVEFAARVVIGYDQERKTVLLHDPSLGPAWEVPEQDFERMWQFSKRKYRLLYPPNYLEVLSAKTSAPPYGARAPDNDAAAHYWYGYALESLDSLEEAEQELRSGLQIPGISKGYEHLLRYELARVLNLRGRDEDAIAEARKAIALMPENPAPWDFVAGWARCCGGKNGKKEAAEAEHKVHSLCAAEAQTRFVRALAVDFDVRGCRGERLGWGVR
jgi:tetratricopeptide (TPR) repeat protein